MPIFSMSPAFGDARGGLVAGSDPVVTEVEPGVPVQGEVQEPPETGGGDQRGRAA